MKIITDISKIGGGKHVPHTIIWHAMGQFIEVNETSSKQLKSVGKNILPGKYHVKEWLTLMGLGVYFLVEEDLVYHCKDVYDITYHAKGFNTGHIGIELLVPGTFYNLESLYEVINEDQWYSEKMWLTMIELGNHIKNICPSVTHMTTHSLLDKRYQGKFKIKQDPGKMFNLEGLKKACNLI